MNKNIEQYLGFSGRSSMGEVQTPNELAQEMINKLPEGIFISDKTTFLDPCFGTGTFLKAAARRFRKYGHSKENINSRLIGVEKSIRFINKAREEWGDFKPTLIHADFLEYDFKDMKFDVVIGNPPFQDGRQEGGQNKIYNLFCKNGLDLLSPTGILYFITPSSVCKKSKRFSLLNQEGLKLVDFTSNNYFKVGVNICSFMIDTSYKGKVKVKNNVGEYFQENNQVVRNSEGVDKDFVKIYDSLKKLLDHPSKRMFKQNNFGTAFSKQPKPTHPYTVYKKKNNQDILVYYSKRIPFFNNDLKFTISMSKGFNLDSCIISTTNYDQNHLTINISNLQEAENIKSFLFSEYFQNHSQKWKELDGYGFNEALKYLPPFDKTKFWTNKEVKEFIENTIK